MSPDILRQRRDLYAVSIALMLFYLAGGKLNEATTLGVLLPVSFANPCWFLYAAWAGFFYFLTRFALLVNGAWSMYREDAHWQARWSPATAKLWSQFTWRDGNGPDTKRYLVEGYLPDLERASDGHFISCEAMQKHAGSGAIQRLHTPRQQLETHLQTAI